VTRTKIATLILNQIPLGDERDDIINSYEGEGWRDVKLMLVIASSRFDIKVDVTADAAHDPYAPQVELL